MTPSLTGPRYAVVVPTLGRPSLSALLDSLAGAAGPLPEQIVLVDDRAEPTDLPDPPGRIADRVRVVLGHGRGPAAARNTGWRALPSDLPWVAFLDDDVLVGPTWCADLAAELGGQPADVAGVQGRVHVPLPADRRPTDWERNTQGLESAAWITADMAYRRTALELVGGFDERFPRAFREDADLALRVQACGLRLVRGDRGVLHPVRRAGPWVSLRVQAGNADDVLMRRLHGRHWRQRAGAPRGRRAAHLAITAAAATAVGGGLTGRRRAVALGLLGWLAGTARFTWARIAPGPRTAPEVWRMAATSVAIPPAATWHWLRGVGRHRAVAAWAPPPRAVLFDRDGTLIHDVPYLGDPARVRPMPGAVDVVHELRARGLRLGVISNQSGVARGRLTQDDVRRVNARVDEIFGPFDVWQWCPHAATDGCACRKPAPGMVLAAASRLGVPPEQVVVIGDIGADVEAARAAGARAVLVPTPQTRVDEVRRAGLVARTLAEAVSLALGGVR